MDLNNTQQKAFDFVADYTKQLITLATAIVTFMITFIDNVFKGSSIVPKVLLLLSWFFYGLSIGFGIMRLMNLTGNLDPLPRSGVVPSPNLTVTSTNVRYSGIAQIILFLAAILFTGIFGCYRIFNEKGEDKKTEPVIVMRETIIQNDTLIRKDTIYLKNIPR
jgi:hypothetical protein